MRCNPHHRSSRRKCLQDAFPTRGEAQRPRAFARTTYDSDYARSCACNHPLALDQVSRSWRPPRNSSRSTSSRAPDDDDFRDLARSGIRGMLSRACGCRGQKGRNTKPQLLLHRNNDRKLRNMLFHGLFGRRESPRPRRHTRSCAPSGRTSTSAAHPWIWLRGDQSEPGGLEQPSLPQSRGWLQQEQCGCNEEVASRSGQTGMMRCHAAAPHCNARAFSTRKCRQLRNLRFHTRGLRNALTCTASLWSPRPSSVGARGRAPLLTLPPRSSPGCS